MTGKLNAELVAKNLLKEALSKLHHEVGGGVQEGGPSCIIVYKASHSLRHVPRQPVAT